MIRRVRHAAWIASVALAAAASAQQPSADDVSLPARCERAVRSSVSSIAAQEGLPPAHVDRALEGVSKRAAARSSSKSCAASRYTFAQRGRF